LLLFLYVTEEAGRKYVRDMPWSPAAECNMITNKQTGESLSLADACINVTSTYLTYLDIAVFDDHATRGVRSIYLA